MALAKIKFLLKVSSCSSESHKFAFFVQPSYNKFLKIKLILKIMYSFIQFAFCDAAMPWQFGFQDPASPIISGIIHLHNNIIFYLILIAFLVCWLLIRAIYLFHSEKNKIANKKFTHSTPLEIVWTITPAFLLLLLAGPSFALLYSIDEVVCPQMSIKVVGHQWYWSYEYSDYFHYVTQKTIAFDSYMLAQDDLVNGGLRLLEVDSRLKLPTQVHIRVLVTSADVLHSWAVPSLGVKIDACPGRLNMVSMYIERSGVFYGQCSEICGVNHGFIPIVVESLPKTEYLEWVIQTLNHDDYRFFNEAEIATINREVEAGKKLTVHEAIVKRFKNYDYSLPAGPHVLGPRPTPLTLEDLVRLRDFYRMWLGDPKDPKNTGLSSESQDKKDVIDPSKKD
jgi:cytochrome c oxidase subunit 2